MHEFSKVFSPGIEYLYIDRFLSFSLLLVGKGPGR
jgi:hypothetical protein